MSTHSKFKKLALSLMLLILILGLSTDKSMSHALSSPKIGFYEIDIGLGNPIRFKDSNVVNLTFFLVSDLHGWIQPHDGYGGAATLMGHFIQEGYSYDNDSFLIFSGGDHNTGPAEATLSKGAAVIDVLNAMNFSAAVIGNHEFDFGYEIMEDQKENANFPLLGCNIYDDGTTDVANFSTPYVIQEHAGIKVGIIGLALNNMYAEVEQDYDFGDYEASLRSIHGEVITAGADIITVLSHIPPNALENLATDVEDLGIELFFGGHAHTSRFSTINSSLIVATEPYAKQYAKVIVSIDNTTKSIVEKSGGLFYNMEGGATPDTSVQQVVDYWTNEINASQVISYASSDVYDGVPESAIGNLVTDSFMNYFDWNHNFGLTNRGGGYRDYFRAGDITLGDIVSVIPFENNLLEITMTGADILTMLYQHHGGYTYSGIRYRFYENATDFIIHSVRIFENDGYYSLSLPKTYTGLITDFNWWQNHYGMFSPVDTEVHYRDTVLDYFGTLDDIVSYSYDDRILETEVELPTISEYRQFTGILLSSAIILSTVILVRKKRIKK